MVQTAARVADAGPSNPLTMSVVCLQVKIELSTRSAELLVVFIWRVIIKTVVNSSASVYRG